MNLSKSKRMIVLLLLSLIAGLVYLTPFLRFSFYDQIKTALGLTDVQMGVIGGTYGALNVLSYIPSGFLTERFNTKRLLLISMLGMLACTLWYATYPPFAALVVIHALYGVFSVGTFWCPYLKAIRYLASEESQGTIFGLSEGLRGVGQTAVAFLCLTSLQFFVQVAAEDLPRETLLAMIAKPELTLFQILEMYPLGHLLCLIAMGLLVTFFVTSANSATFVLAMLTSGGKLDPPVSKKVFWGLLIAVLALALIFSGGISMIQTISIVIAFPYLLFLILICISLVLAFRRDSSA